MCRVTELMSVDEFQKRVDELTKRDRDFLQEVQEITSAEGMLIPWGSMDPIDAINISRALYRNNLSAKVFGD